MQTGLFEDQSLKQLADSDSPKVYEFRIVRSMISDSESLYQAKASSPGNVFDCLKDYFSAFDREHFVALHLDSRLQIVAREIISIGTLDCTVASPREVFKGAVINSSKGIIVCHNHPSGDPAPSQNDRELTKRLKEAGNLLEINLHDHIIFGHKSFYSFCEQGSI